MHCQPRVHWSVSVAICHRQAPLCSSRSPGEKNAHRRPQGNQEPRIPRRPDAVFGAGNGCPWPSGDGRNRCRQAGIGATDEVYQKAGAAIAATAEEIFATAAEMIVKVKEPQAGERAMLREGQILYTYLHLAPDPAAVCRPGQERRRLHRL
jgi:hypothetical protein